jgi:hypothetical protein
MFAEPNAPESQPVYGRHVHWQFGAQWKCRSDTFHARVWFSEDDIDSQNYTG